jgi:tRNA threonylcarbamoyladenosine biosynthesis protein TsaE
MTVPAADDTSAILLELPTAEHTAALGRRLAGQLACGDLLTLDGPLGAGKTTLVRGLVAGLDGDVGLVASPTFALVHRYQARVPVVHVDAYRLAGAHEWAALGLDELAEEVLVVVEWAERVRAALPASCWRLELEHAASGRHARLRPPHGKRLQDELVTGMLL